MPENDLDRPIMNSLTDDLNLLVEAARSAGEIAHGFFGQSPETWYKGDERSPVSEADMAVDVHLRTLLTAARPDYGWLSEESIDAESRLDRGMVFIVDPIDGTRGFIGGKKDWCVSVAIVENGRPVAGVLAAPARGDKKGGEIWVASTGQGAWLDGKRLDRTKSPAPARPLEVSMSDMLANHAIKKYPAEITRKFGGPSLALRLARVASGEIGGVLIRPHANEWDLAAADLIMREAGYLLVDDKGVELTYNRPDPSYGYLAAGAPGDIDLLKRCLPV